MGSHYIARSGRGLGVDTTTKILTAKIQKRPIRENFQLYSRLRRVFLVPIEIPLPVYKHNFIYEFVHSFLPSATTYHIADNFQGKLVSLFSMSSFIKNPRKCQRHVSRLSTRYSGHKIKNHENLISGLFRGFHELRPPKITSYRRPGFNCVV